MLDPLPPAYAPTVLQYASAIGSGSSLNVSINGPSSGNALVVVILIGNTTTVSSVLPDVGPPVFSQAANISYAPGGGLGAEVWVADAPNAATSQVTVTKSGTGYARAIVMEIENAELTDLVEATRTASYPAAGATVDTGNISPVLNNTLLISGFINRGDQQAEGITTDWGNVDSLRYDGSIGTSFAINDEIKAGGTYVAERDVAGTATYAVAISVAINGAAAVVPTALEGYDKSNLEILQAA